MNANKRILCIIMALVLCMSSAVIAVSAEKNPSEPNQMYKDLVFGSLGSRVNEHYSYRCEYVYNADGSTPDDGEMPDYILAWASAEAVSCVIIEQVIGDYYFHLPHAYHPYDLGYFIYSAKENRCYSLDAAWESQLPEIDKILAMVGTPVDEVDNDLTRYRNKIISKLGWEDVTEAIEYRLIMEYNADGSTVDEGATPDYAVVFAHTGGILCWEVYEYFGNYKLSVPAVYNPGFIIYSIGEDKIYTIRQAYNQGLPGMDLVLENIGVKVTLYADVFEKFLEPYKDNSVEDSEYGWYSYDELYYYSYQKRYGSTEMFEITPDYVLVDAMAYHSPPIDAYDVIGDYIVTCGCGNPDHLRYYVYTPKDDKIYTLREAYEAGIKDIDKVFTDYGLGTLIGDLDNDRKLTIKDATYLQKCLAKIEGFELPESASGLTESEYVNWMANIADFDFDNSINIKDATAIQKHLAKISE